MQRDGADKQVVCRPSDLHSGKRSAVELSVEDLQFTLFRSILEEGMEYEECNDTIYYESKNAKDIIISCKRAWRAALEDMYAKGREYFTFVVRRVQHGAKATISTGSGVQLLTSSPGTATKGNATKPAATQQHAPKQPERRSTVEIPPPGDRKQKNKRMLAVTASPRAKRRRV